MRMLLLILVASTPVGDITGGLLLSAFIVVTIGVIWVWHRRENP